MRNRIGLWCTLVFLFFSLSVVTRSEEPTDPRRPTAIDTEGVPVIPQEVSDRLRQYSHIRQAEFAGWSPDGKGMLVATRFGNSVQLHRVYEPGGRREQVTFFDEPVEGRPVPKAADGAILMSMSQGGDENFQSYLLVPNAFSVTRLTDGKSRNEPGPVSDDGSQFVVHSNRRNGRDMDILVGDVRRADSLRTVLETKDDYWLARDWSPDRSKLLVSRYVSINESYPAILDVANGQLTSLPLPAEGKAAVGALAFTADGAAALVSCDARSEFLQLFRLDLKSLKYEPIVADLKWDIDDIEVEPGTGRVAYTTNEDGASGLYLLEGDQSKRIDVPVGVTRGFEFSPDGKQLGFTLSRPDLPGDAYSIDLGNGHLTRWTFSEAGGLNPEKFVRPERIQFPSFDGRVVPAWCFRPRDAAPQKPAPVLVIIHGGPESQYRPTFTASIQYYVSELGLAVVCPNVRGSSGYGKTYLKLDNGPLRENSVKDIGALLDWISTQKDLDASRVAVSGGSYGGYMVLASLEHFGDRLRAGIDIVGIADWITFLKNTSPYRQDRRRAEYGDERNADMRAVFERISPLANAGRIRSALLVAHGRNDPRVPFTEAEQIAQRVRAAGKPVWTVYADNEGHGFAKKDNRDYLTAVESVFLLNNLVKPAK
jgi:dipeptidyl aminopeptidase/acylaminoacyl peptidase